MLEQLAFLASYSFFGQGSVGQLLSYWQQQGVFSYVLPFLLIFALVFVTLSSMKLFGENKGVSVVVAICVALLSLQFDVVPIFFSEIFPRVGIALSVMLGLLVVLGLFIDMEQTWTKYMFLGAAFITIFVILFQISAVSSAWYNLSYFFDSQTFTWAFLGLIVVVAIAVITNTKPKPRTLPPFYPPLSRRP